MKKILDFLKKPAVTHALAVGLTAAGTYLATGHVDVLAILKGLGLQ